MADAVAIKGLDEILRKMKALGGKQINNAGRRALRRGANVVRKAAIQNAKSLDDPESEEKIWKNIAVVGGGKRERELGGPMMRVGVRGGAKSKKGGGSFEVGGSKDNPGGDTWYWRLLEFGTSEIPARPFLRPALANNVEAATNVIASALSTELDKEIAKL